LRPAGCTIAPDRRPPQACQGWTPALTSATPLSIRPSTETSTDSWLACEAGRVRTRASRRDRNWQHHDLLVTGASPAMMLRCGGQWPTMGACSRGGPEGHQEKYGWVGEVGVERIDGGVFGRSLLALPLAGACPRRPWPELAHARASLCWSSPASSLPRARSRHPWPKLTHAPPGRRAPALDPGGRRLAPCT
jgi:hypothetical protein